MTPLPSLSTTLASPAIAAEPRARGAAREPAREAEAPRGFARALGAARSEPPRRADAPRTPNEAPADDDGGVRARRDGDEAQPAEDTSKDAPPTADAAASPPAAARWAWPAEAPPPAAAGGTQALAADTTSTDDTEAALRTAAPGANVRSATAGESDPLADLISAAADARLPAGSAGQVRDRAAALPGGPAGGGAGSSPAAAHAGTHGATSRAVPATGASDDAAVTTATNAISAAEATSRGPTPRAEPGSFASALAAAQPAALPAAAAPATTGLGDSTPAPGTAHTAEASLASPPGSPGFTRELSARLVTFVREGIEQARLHLNPAEMGPVEVRIAIEGDAARVLMAAEQAPTRQWLEQALPSLASGLREAGLTLAGGGVFDRAPGGGPGGQPPAHQGGSGAAPGERSGATAAAEAVPAGVPRRRGVVDLVA